MQIQSLIFVNTARNLLIVVAVIPQKILKIRRDNSRNSFEKKNKFIISVRNICYLMDNLLLLSRRYHKISSRPTPPIITNSKCIIRGLSYLYNNFKQRISLFLKFLTNSFLRITPFFPSPFYSKSSDLFDHYQFKGKHIVDKLKQA